MQGPDLASLDKDRGLGGLRMEQPLFMKDFPSAGMAPPQVEACLLWYSQALLEHSGEVAGLHGAILSASGAL